MKLQRNEDYRIRGQRQKDVCYCINKQISHKFAYFFVAAVVVVVGEVINTIKN